MGHPLRDGSALSKGVCLRQSLSRHKQIFAGLVGPQQLLSTAIHLAGLYGVVPKAAQTFEASGLLQNGRGRGQTTLHMGF